jgi:hypothetical protein
MKASFAMILFIILLTSTMIAQTEKALFAANNGPNGKGGFIDVNGKVQIPFQYDEVFDFAEGFAAVRNGDKWGYIDKTGKFLVSPMYDFAYPFKSGVAKVVFRDSLFVINQGGGRIYIQNLDYDEFNNGLVKISKDGLWGFVNQHGKVIIPFEYDEAGDFSENTGYARMDGEWTFFDTSGNTVFKTGLTPKGGFSEGLIMVVNGDKYGYLDKAGKPAIPLNLQFRNNTVNAFSDGLAVFQQGANYYSYKMGCIDKTGKVVIEPQFRLLYPFYEKLAVFTEELSGYIGQSGKILIPAVYENAFRFSEGHAIAIRKSGDSKYQYEILRPNGEIVRTFEAYEGIRDETRFVNGLCKLHCPVAPGSGSKNKDIEQWGGVKTIFVNFKGQIVWESEPWYSCFPATARVLMSDFTEKCISEIKPGDEIMGPLQNTGRLSANKVIEIQIHPGSHQLIEVFYSPGESLTASTNDASGIPLRSICLTKNHPVLTSRGPMPSGNLAIGDEVFIFDDREKRTTRAKIEKIVHQKIAVDKVYNLKTDKNAYIVDGIMVLMK